VRTALFVGYATVFGLWLAWGFQLTRSLEQVWQSVTEVHDSFLRGERLRASLRGNFLTSSIYLRDALLDNAPERRRSYQVALDRLRVEADELLDSYRSNVALGIESDIWKILQIELTEFRAAHDLALAGQAMPTRQSIGFVRVNVIPQRESVLAVIDQMEQLELSANERRNAELSDLYARVRAQLISMGSATLLLALVGAVVAARQVDRLQREVQRRHALLERNQEDLRRLSADLISAREQDRRKLAQELHDEVGQALTAVKMDIGLALRSQIDARVRSALEEARDLSETTLKNVRDMSQLLHPSILDDFGLPSALANYLRRYSSRTGIQATLSEKLPGRPGSDVELCVYRIVQETLTNVARHSGADHCTVTIDTIGDEVTLRVADDGGGLHPTGHVHQKPGLGLIGMRERVQALGGTFTAGNRPEGGTEIVVRLPFATPMAPVDLVEDAARRAG
jgi:signal transduction histidine kinase